MPDKVKELIDKVLAWWNKFTAKQKTIIIGITAAVVFTFFILIWAFTRPQYVQFQQCSTTSEAAEIIEILDSNQVDYTTSTDGLRISVKTSQMSVANLALGAAGYVPDAYTVEEALSGGFTSTQSDAQRRWQYFLKTQFESDIMAIDSVKSASVNLHIPDNTGTLISTSEEASAWIQLTLRDRLTSEQATTIARAVATALGNSSTANITIVDNEANLLFSGEEDYTTAGIASNMLELRSQVETYVGAEVKKVLIGSQQFDMVEVACRLNIDYAEYQNTVHEYYANEGYEQGMLSHRESINEENTSGSGGIPGTDSNGDDLTSYQYDLGDSSESSSSSLLEDFLPNESLSVENLPAGVVDYDASSMALTAITYRIVKEDDARRQGLLDGVSWEDYKSTNNVYVKQEVDEDFYGAVANATGIPQDSITIIAYEIPQFIDSEGMDISVTDILSVVLIVIILGLLAFVVIKSMAARRDVEPEEELSVETLLQSTPEPPVEDIEVETKSETRKMIEKFVDDNPEAAANLLRNWLNEDWS